MQGLEQARESRPAAIAGRIPCRTSGRPLNLLVGSTGLEFRSTNDGLSRKRGPSRLGHWREVHIARGADTGDIRAVEFTSIWQGDSPLLPELLAQMPRDEQIKTLTADGAHDMRRCHGATVEQFAGRKSSPSPEPSEEEGPLKLE